MNHLIGKKVLITTNNWFVAPDGLQYRAVYGELIAVHEAGKTLGFIPNRAHANWFVEVGNMIIMGCQVLYVIDAPTAKMGWVTDTLTAAESKPESGKKVPEFKRPSYIYYAVKSIKKS